MAGMPGGRHLSVLSDDESPATRAFEMACHFARYSGVSFGALGARPREPSESGAVRVGGGSGCPGAGPRRAAREAVLHRVRPAAGRRR